MIRTIVILLGMLLLMSGAAMNVHAQEDGCDLDDLDFLAADYLHHMAQARNATERLNLSFEYLTFLLMCREAPVCHDLNTTYAGRLTDAETLDDLLLVNADFTADLLLCASGAGQVDEAGLAEFTALGLDCTALFVDADYVYAECSHSQAIAQAMYEAALAHLMVEGIVFDALLDDGAITNSYIYTGEEWLVMPHVE